ncbi:MAG: hypothetical protein ACKVVT_18690, partial [Dehalococcoidia bacterium]
MARLHIRAFRQDDIPQASALLAARQAADIARFPFFKRELVTPAGATAAIEVIAAKPQARGAVAERDGRIAGYLFTEPQLFSPVEMMALFLAPHSVSVPLEGYGAVAGEDLEVLYRDLYGFLAEGWVREGFFEHTVEIVAGDAELQEAFVALGFGRHLTAATRPTAGLVTSPVAAGIDVHRAGAEDIGVVMELADELNRHHALAPMFWPLIVTAEPAARGFNLAML